MVLTEVVSLVEGARFCYRGNHFNEGKMVILQRASVLEGEWSCYERWSVKWRENGHLTEVATLMEGEWSCYRGGH